VKIGKIINWNDDRGFGFIEIENTNERIFVHIKSFNDRYFRPQNNQVVRFDLYKDKDNRSYAKNVSRDTDRIKTSKRYKSKSKSKESNSNKSSFSYIKIMIILTFWISIIIFFSQNKIPLQMIIFPIIINYITYFVYQYDKFKAEQHKYRVSENTLHLLSIFGGWTGAMIAQYIFRHKTKKTSFISIFWLTVIINIFLIYKIIYKA